MQIWLTGLADMSCLLWKYVSLAKINCYFLDKTVRVGFFPGGSRLPEAAAQFLMNDGSQLC